MNKIKGILDGWEVVRIDVPKIGEWYIGFSGHPEQAQSQYNSVLTIIRKIEKPKQYRPFKNAAEFAPHRERWWMFGVDIKSHRRPPQDYNNCLYGCWEWEDMFELATFDDGTPFGVEVKS